MKAIYKKKIATFSMVSFKWILEFSSAYLKIYFSLKCRGFIKKALHINGWILYDFYFWWALIWKECQEYSAKCVLLLLSLMKLKGRTLGIIYAPSNLLSHFLEVRSIINKSINLVCVNPKVIYFILSDLWTPKYDWPIQKYFISHSF